MEIYSFSPIPFLASHSNFFSAFCCLDNHTMMEQFLIILLENSKFIFWSRRKKMWSEFSLFLVLSLKILLLIYCWTYVIPENWKSRVTRYCMFVYVICGYSFMCMYANVYMCSDTCVHVYVSLIFTSFPNFSMKPFSLISRFPFLTFSLVAFDIWKLYSPKHGKWTFMLKVESVYFNKWLEIYDLYWHSTFWKWYLPLFHLSTWSPMSQNEVKQDFIWPLWERNLESFSKLYFHNF